MADVEPTELVELDVEKVSGVESPASGTTFLVLKASADDDDTQECSTCKGKGKILEGNRACPDCDGSGQVAKAAADATEDGDAEKAKLSAAELNDLPDKAFAHIEPGGEKDSEGKTTPRSKRHFAIHDKTHADNAAARIAQGAQFGHKALPKVKAAQAKFGEDNASKGAVQDALHGTATPERAGYDPTTGQSGVAGPVTTGARALAEPRTAGGGQSTYTIPAEDKQDLTKTAGPHVAFAVSSLVDAIEHLAEIRDLSQRATKAGMTLTPPSPDESAAPGSMPWESYDSATLAQVAQSLASCDAAITAIIARERAEADSAVHPDDYINAWDLQDAQAAMDCALGIVARLSFTEAAEADKADVAKAGRRISAKTESTLRAARDHLTSVIGDGDDDKADTGDTSSEGDKIKMDVTKQELAEAIVAGVKEVLKNANNGGDISEGEIHDNGTVGEDLALPGAGTTRPGVTKEAGQQDDVTKQVGQQDAGQQDVAKQLKALTEEVARQGEQLGKVDGQVTKMARAPRGGGPILTGQLPAGIAAAGEGRQDGVAKSDDQEVARLEKQLGEASDPMARQHLSMVLTQRKLAAFHRTAGV
jgi:hypothetical protein